MSSLAERKARAEQALSSIPKRTEPTAPEVDKGIAAGSPTSSLIKEFKEKWGDYNSTPTSTQATQSKLTPQQLDDKIIHKIDEQLKIAQIRGDKDQYIDEEQLHRARDILTGVTKQDCSRDAVAARVGETKENKNTHTNSAADNAIEGAAIALTFVPGIGGLLGSTVSNANAAYRVTKAVDIGGQMAEEMADCNRRNGHNNYQPQLLTPPMPTPQQQKTDTTPKNKQVSGR